MSAFYEKWTEADHRRNRILDALFKAAERKGIAVSNPEPSTLFFTVNGEQLEFSLRKQQKRVKVQRPERDLKTLTPGEKPWTLQLKTMEALVFSFKKWQLPTSVPQRWEESADKPLEGQLDAILAALLQAGPILVQKRLDNEERERQYREAAHQRYLEEQERKLDVNRWRRFRELAVQWKELETFAAFLDAVEARAEDQTAEVAGKQIAEWLLWCRAKLAEADPLRHGPDGIFKDLSEVTNWTYRE